MTVRIKEKKGNSKMFAMIEHSVENGDKAARTGLYRVGKMLTKKARDGIKQGPKTGNYYPYKGRRKRASSPGQFPANRSGELRRSIDFDIDGAHLMTFGANTEYAGYLEEGTENMIKRPYLIKVMRKNRQETRNILSKAFDEEMKRG